jgi:hypothetical protein
MNDLNYRLLESEKSARKALGLELEAKISECDSWEQKCGGANKLKEDLAIEAKVKGIF